MSDGGSQLCYKKMVTYFSRQLYPIVVFGFDGGLPFIS
jgi:hypothetical protein